MKNTFYIDDNQKNKTLKTLGKIYQTKLQINKIQNLVDNQIKETQIILKKMEN